jgi:hypothetical protein
MQSNHCPEKNSYPADKMLPVEEGRNMRNISSRVKKSVKKDHTRRSRRYLKRKLNDEATRQ